MQKDSTMINKRADPICYSTILSTPKPYTSCTCECWNNRILGTQELAPQCPGLSLEDLKQIQDGLKEGLYDPLIYDSQRYRIWQDTQSEIDTGLLFIDDIDGNNIGGQLIRGSKHGEWKDVEIHCSYQQLLILRYEGKYQNGMRVGDWVIRCDKLSVIGGGTYNENGVKDGQWTDIDVQCCNRNMMILLWEGVYNNGNRDGEWVVKKESGEQIGGGRYEDGVKQGKWTELCIHCSCREILIVIEFGEYTDGIKVGKWVSMRENCCQRYGGIYKLGRKEGLWTELDVHSSYYNQILIESGEYEDDNRVAQWIIMDIDFNVCGGGEYKSGNKSGEWVELQSQSSRFDKLTLIQKGVYIDGFRNGKWSIVNDKADIGGGMYRLGIKVGQWVDIDVHCSRYDLFILINQGCYDQGIQIGQWLIAFENGEEVGGGLYEQGVKQGNWIEVYVHGFYYNILLKHIGEYQNGNRINQWMITKELGTEICGGNYIQGMKDGHWKEVEAHCSNLNKIYILNEGHYKMGTRVNDWYISREYGNTIGGGQYKNGIKDGQWKDIEVFCTYLNINIFIHNVQYNNGYKTNYLLLKSEDQLEINLNDYLEEKQY